MTNYIALIQRIYQESKRRINITIAHLHDAEVNAVSDNEQQQQYTSGYPNNQFHSDTNFHSGKE